MQPYYCLSSEKYLEF